VIEGGGAVCAKAADDSSGDTINAAWIGFMGYFSQPERRSRNSGFSGTGALLNYRRQ
jgi:hypothetical protein